MMLSEAGLEFSREGACSPSHWVRQELREIEDTSLGIRKSGQAGLEILAASLTSTSPLESYLMGNRNLTATG